MSKNSPNTNESQNANDSSDDKKGPFAFLAGLFWGLLGH